MSRATSKPVVGWSDRRDCDRREPDWIPIF